MARDRRQRKGVAARRGSERLNRTEGSRQPRRTYVRFCEGKRTEPSYFEGIRRQLRRAAVDIRVRPQVGSPSRLVRHAVRADLDGVDEVWCLFDVEAPEPHGDLDEALRLAAGNPAIRLAVSNPCFELWLLLHFEDWRSYLTSAEARTRLADWLPNTGKHLDARDRAVAVMFAQVDSAIARAVRLEPDASASVITKRNPSTLVWELLQSLDPVRTAPTDPSG